MNLKRSWIQIKKVQSFQHRAAEFGVFLGNLSWLMRTSILAASNTEVVVDMAFFEMEVFVDKLENWQHC